MKRIPETCMRMEILRGWEIMDEIGAGGYGVVFRVRSNKTNEEAALKWIHIERDDARGFDGELFLDAQTNLLNEISVMKKLSDTPEIVSIYDAAYQIAPSGNEMDVIILMELLSPLTGILKNGEITVMQVGQMTDDVARALSVCHERDIIHGDVKPENILCGKNNYKLSDFGVSLSKLMPGRTEARGTQYFRPPEYERSQNASKQGDVYSLGMMLYVLFNNGRLPFQSGFSAEDESRAWQEYRNLSLLPDGALPRPQFAASAIADVILRAISPDMQARYRTVSEFVSDFDAAFAHLSAAEKALPLPYCKSDEFLSEEVKMYLSTGRKTPTFDMNSAPEPEKKPEPVSQSSRQAGFVIPTATIQEKKADSETKNTKEEKKKTAKARFLLIPLIIVLAATCVFAYIRFAPAAFEYEKVISETDAVFTLLSGGKADFSASCLPEGAQYESVFAQGENGKVRLSGLVPGTKYAVTLKSGKKTVKTEITTLAEKDGSFTPGGYKVYTAEKSVSQNESFRQMELEGKLAPVSDGKIVLRNAPMQEQNKAIFVEFRCDTILSEITSASELIVSVKDAQGNLYTGVVEYAPVRIPDENVRLYYDLTGIFERMYKSGGKYVSGKYTVRMYWLSESVGSLELDVKCEG